MPYADFTMSDSTLRASIKTLMDTVTGIGMVHATSRWAADDAKLRSLFQKNANAPLHGWEITREGIPQNQRITNAKYKWTHSYLVLGHYAVRDNVSEPLFNAVVDVVCQKFLDNIIPGSEAPHPVPTVTIKEWMFGGVLCHRAEIRIQVAEIVAMTAETSDALLKVMLCQYLAPGAATMWQANTDYAADANVVPTAPNGHRYKCTVAGISNAIAEPAWPTGAEATVADGTITWTEDGVVVTDGAEIIL